MNPILQKAKAQIESKVPSDQKNAYDRIVLAGMKYMFSKQTFAQLSKGIKEAPDKIATATDGVIGILIMLQKQSKGTMPIAPMVQAGMDLLIEALAFIDDAGIIKVGNEQLDTATHRYLDTLLPRLGVSPDKMNGLMSKLQPIMADKAKMAAYKSGVAQ